MIFSTSDGRGLLLQRFGKLAGALLLGLEQPNVLDRDRGLIGKGRKKSDLILVEGLHFGAAHQDAAQRAILAYQRNSEDSAMPESPCEFASSGKIVARVLLVFELYGLHVANGAPHDGGTVKRHFADVPSQLAVGSAAAQDIAFEHNDIDNLCFADAGCVFGN